VAGNARVQRVPHADLRPDHDRDDDLASTGSAAHAAAAPGAEAMSRAILKVSGLCMRFGGLLAVNGVNLTVKEKQVVSMIGPNGAGKTTVFNCLNGFYQPTAGEILLDGDPIQGLPGHKIARKGVVRTLQNVRLFKEMTAVENLLVAQHQHLNTNFFAGLFKTPGYRKSEKEAMRHA